jgi:carboxyl-terminal processing protease
VVGDKTFGDGSVQKLIEMPDSSALILSIAKYYSPGGKAIQDVSVTPNVLVADTVEDDAGLPDEEEQATPGEKPADKKDEKPKNLIDDQLNKALEVLKNRETKG